ncbi:hypothetical protein Lsan_2903 [Legionella santicrucis]|uniref:Uncharacterized protein n=1 Tax=Legionella santicrucis TaxID=45074 RepID=A0A0W0YIT2_9GAMM|nr:hypothetical protein [Legionella santicrucis]KTD56743.1 hypothetical protein Lsan_2903 [Legionella santicrucis]
MKKILILFSLCCSVNLLAATINSTIKQTNSPVKNNTNGYVLHDTLIKELPSKINGVKYNLYISLPKDYASNNKTYPIIYLLDADYSFAFSETN